MKAANKQLTEWDAELNQLHERNGDLGLKVQMLEEELKEARRDREEIEKLRSELAAEQTPQHQLYAEIEQLKERNRLLLIKSREERQRLQEKISTLEYRDESQSRRLKEKQNRLDELELDELEELQQKSDVASRNLPEAADLLNRLKARRKKSRADLADVEAILEILLS